MLLSKVEEKTAKGLINPNFIDGDDLFTYTPSQQILSPDPSLGRLDPASLTVSHDPGVNVSKAPASTRQLPKELYRQRTAETLRPRNCMNLITPS